MKKLLLLLFTSLSLFQAHAQDWWVKQLPIRGVPIKMIKTHDEGYALLARTHFSESPKISLFKYDKDGNLLWQKKYVLADSSSIEAYDFVETKSDNGFAIVGRVYAGGFIDKQIFGYLLKVNNTGDSLWMYHSPYTSLSDSVVAYKKIVEKSISNGLWMIGGNSKLGVYVHKFDENGNLLSIFSQEPLPNSANNIKITSSNINCVITKDLGSTQEVFELDEDFNKSNIHTYHSIRAVICSATNDGGFIYYNKGVTKLSVFLDSVWARPSSYYDFGGGIVQEPTDIKQTDDGGYVLCGRIGNALFKGIYVIKTDNTGVTEWTKDYPQTVANELVNIEQAADGGYVMFQSGDVDANKPVMFLVKTRPDGTIDIFDTPAPDPELFTAYNNGMGSLCVQLKQPLSGCSIVVYNITGQLLQTKAMADIYEELDINSLRTGQYVLLLQQYNQSLGRYIFNNL